MDQETRWLKRYNVVKNFIEENHRNPSKHRIEEHDMLNWVKAERIEALMMLLDLWEENKHLNHL